MFKLMTKIYKIKKKLLSIYLKKHRVMDMDWHNLYVACIKFRKAYTIITKIASIMDQTLSEMQLIQ